jgi:hypothetical protein
MADNVHVMCRLAIDAQDQYIGEQVARLRELLAHCQAEAITRPIDGAEAYDDVATRLTAILDNVTGVEREV